MLGFSAINNALSPEEFSFVRTIPLDSLGHSSTNKLNISDIATESTSLVLADLLPSAYIIEINCLTTVNGNLKVYHFGKGKVYQFGENKCLQKSYIISL